MIYRPGAWDYAIKLPEVMIMFPRIARAEGLYKLYIMPKDKEPTKLRINLLNN